MSKTVTLTASGALAAPMAMCDLVELELKALRELGLMHESQIRAAMLRISTARITERNGDGYIYMASPYSHPDPDIRHQRFVMAACAAAAMMRKGRIIYSPIAATVPFEIHGGLPGTWDFWEKYDRGFVSAAESVLVLMLDGYKESKGVNAEIKIAEECRLPVSYISYREAVE